MLRALDPRRPGRLPDRVIAVRLGGRCDSRPGWKPRQQGPIIPLEPRQGWDEGAQSASGGWGDSRPGWKPRQRTPIIPPEPRQGWDEGARSACGGRGDSRPGCDLAHARPCDLLHPSRGSAVKRTPHAGVAFPEAWNGCAAPAAAGRWSHPCRGSAVKPTRLAGVSTPAWNGLAAPAAFRKPGMARPLRGPPPFALHPTRSLASEILFLEFGRCVL
jgi:hypothetical protein